MLRALQRRSRAADPHTESQEAASTGIGAFGGQRADAGCRTPETPLLRQLRPCPPPGSWRCPMPTSAVHMASVPASSRPLGSGRPRPCTLRTRRLRRGRWAFLLDKPRTTVSDRLWEGPAGSVGKGSQRGGLGDPEGEPRQGPRVTWRVSHPSKATPPRGLGESDDGAELFAGHRAGPISARLAHAPAPTTAALGPST